MTTGHDLQDGGQQLVLGKVLLERGMISADQLREALSERARRVSSGDPITTSLGSILVSKGFLTDQQLVELLAEQSAERAEEQAPPPPPPQDVSIHITPQASAVGITPSGVFPKTGAVDPLTGADRLGKYSLVKELGRGGMGVVYEALDTELNRRCALKLMLSSPTADPKEVALEEERFIREAQLSAKLKHPNIVTVFEASIIDGRRYLAMELIEGLPLSQWRQENKVPLKQQVEVLRDVAMAVHHAHEQGILHRDLKPRNVLIGKNNQPYVTDFGLAKTLGRKASDSLTHSGMVVGTPAYMSPEQAQGLDKIDWRTDIYSLGVMLYEILTGQTPFTGESPIEILMKVVKDPVPLPTKVAKPEVVVALDRNIENICLKALAKKDRDRYVTAKAFGDDITKWVRGEAVKVTAPKQQSKRPGRAILMGVLLGALAVAGFFGWQLTKSTRSPAEYLAMAKLARQEGRLDDAHLHYQMALQLDASNGDAIAGLAEVRIELKRAEIARESKLREEITASLRKANQLQDEAEKLKEAASNAKTEKERKEAEARQREAERLAKAAKEEAFRKKQELGKSGPAPPDLGKGPVGEVRWEDQRNLLELVEPARDAVRGNWAIDEENLVSARLPRSTIEIPYAPPPEYDVRMRFARRSGSDGVAIILSGLGKPFAWVLGGDSNRFFGFDSIEGAPLKYNPSSIESSRCLENARTYTTTIEVRSEGVRAFLDGEFVAQWNTKDYSEFKLDKSWTLRGRPVLGLGSHLSSTVFYEVKIIEKTGQGRDAGPAESHEFVGAPVNLANLKPGLVAEYYYGTRFESLGVRKVVSRLSFPWGQTALWLGGPKDFFSCRWSGYLHVPASGEYTFVLRGDDGFRFEIDGVQLASRWSILKDEKPTEVSCRLRGGLHRIVLEHFEFMNRANFSVMWSKKGLNRFGPISEQSLYHDPGNGELYVAPRPPEMQAALSGHTNEVAAAAFSPDGTMLATGSKDRSIRLWVTKSWTGAKSLSGHPSGTLALAFSPDGKLLASGGFDKKVRLWDAARSVEILSLEGHTEFVAAVAFSRDGKFMASGSYDGTIRVWDVGTASETRVLKGAGGVTSLTFLPDNTHLLAGSTDHSLIMYDYLTGDVHGRFPGHADWIEEVVVSPDGSRFASASADGRILLWNLKTGERVREFKGHSSEVLSLAFGANGTILASGGRDTMVRVWDVGSGRQRAILPGHSGAVHAVAFAPDGRTLVSGSFDGTVRIWTVNP